jgi:hypothetical protein
MLVPNELDPARLERPVPLPLPRPKIDGPVAMVERREEPVASVPSTTPKTTEARKTEAKTTEVRTVDKTIPLPKASPFKKRQ